MSGFHLFYATCGGLLKIISNSLFLYTPRFDFVEYEILAEGVKEHTPSLCVEKERFFGGALDGELIGLINSEGHKSSIDFNGAKVVAMMINQKYCTINI